MIGFACSSNYTHCANGTCTLEPASLFLGATAIPVWQNGDFDDHQIGLRLPFPIILYNYSTVSVNVTTNGVSKFSYLFFGRCING